MDWNKLQTFLVLTRSGNLARAARALDTNPTTVSRRVQALERELTITLFQQTRGGRVLTEDGRRLLTQVEAMERAALNFEDNRDHIGGESGLVRVSAAEGFGTRFIAPRAGLFTSAYPGIAIDLFANSGFLNPSKKEADIAILLAQPRKGPLKTRKLTDYALGLYMSSQYAGEPDALPLVGYIPDFIYAPELDYLGDIKLGREPMIRSSSINAQAQVIAAGAAIGVLPCFMADPDPALIRIRPDINITRTFWLAVHQDMTTLPRIRAFIDWLVAATLHNRRLLCGIAEDASSK